MSKANDERMFLLDRFSGDGWMFHPWRGLKKWDAHAEKLTRDGLLETDEYGMWRITDAGRAALAEHIK